jgi:hypothetical protein
MGRKLAVRLFQRLISCILVSLCATTFLVVSSGNVALADEPPTVEWSKTFGDSSPQGAKSVDQTSDGGYIIVGDNGAYESPDADVLLMKTDGSGNSQWYKTIGGSSFDGGASVQQTSDGGYILTGYTASGPGERAIYLVKVDSSGNREWESIFGGGAWQEGTSVCQTSDGGYIVAGYTASYGAGRSDFWLIKTDPGGNLQWDKTYGGMGYDDACAIQQTSDGGFIVIGWTNSYGAGGEDVWLVKTDSAGNRQWDKTFGGVASDLGTSVQQTLDGGYVITGQTKSYGAGNGDVWLIKADPFGNKQWDTTFGGSAEDYGASVQQTADGGFIIGGSTDSYGAGILAYILSRKLRAGY